MLKTISRSQVLPAAGDYSAEDVLSNSTTATNHNYFYFPNVVKKGGDFGKIVEAQLLCTTTNLKFRPTLYLYKNPPTCELRDNVANTGPLTADIPSYQKRIDLPAFDDLGGVSDTQANVNTYGNLPLLFQTEYGNTGLYVMLVTRDAEANEAANMVMTIILTISDKVED